MVLCVSLRVHLSRQKKMHRAHNGRAILFLLRFQRPLYHSFTPWIDDDRGEPRGFEEQKKFSFFLKVR